MEIQLKSNPKCVFVVPLYHFKLNFAFKISETIPVETTTLFVPWHTFLPSNYKSLLYYKALACVCLYAFMSLCMST